MDLRTSERRSMSSNCISQYFNTLGGYCTRTARRARFKRVPVLPSIDEYRASKNSERARKDSIVISATPP
jgi:hypothetical protein